jgi:hypothetical protein
VTRDTGIALGLLALAGLYWLGADQIKVSRLEGIVGAQAVPKSLAIALAILAALLIAQNLWRVRGAAAAPATREPDSGRTDGHLRAAGMLLIGMAYLAVVGTIGYLPAIALLGRRTIASPVGMRRRWGRKASLDHPCATARCWPGEASALRSSRVLEFR